MPTIQEGDVANFYVGAGSGTWTGSWYTGGGTATGGVDYQVRSGSGTYPGNGLIATAQTYNDSVYEGDEFFYWYWQTTSNGSGSGAYPITISDNADKPVLSINAPTVYESDGTVTVTITASNPAKNAYSLSVSNSGLSALSGSDFSQQTINVTMPAMATSVTVTFNILNDQIDEDGETFSVQASSPFSQASGKVLILDDDADFSSLESVAEAANAVSPSEFTSSLIGLSLSLSSEAFGALDTAFSELDFKGAGNPYHELFGALDDAGEVVTDFRMYRDVTVKSADVLGFAGVACEVLNAVNTIVNDVQVNGTVGKQSSEASANLSAAMLSGVAGTVYGLAAEGVVIAGLTAVGVGGVTAVAAPLLVGAVVGYYAADVLKEPAKGLVQSVVGGINGIFGTDPTMQNDPTLQKLSASTGETGNLPVVLTNGSVAGFAIGQASPKPSWTYDVKTGVFEWLERPDDAVLDLLLERAGGTLNGLVIDAITDLKYIGSNTLLGAFGADQVKGSNLSELIATSAGNDQVSGGGGRDIIDGGAGNDNLNGGTANDFIFGGDGNDILDGAAGADNLQAGAGDDELRSDSIADRNSATGTAENIDGGAGVDHALINRSASAVAYNFDLASGNVANIGDATKLVGIERLTFVGGTAADSIKGGALADSLSGGAGVDRLDGAGGNDLLYSDSQSDAASTNGVAETLIGGAGTDTAIIDRSGSNVTYVLKRDFATSPTTLVLLQGDGTTLTDIEHVVFRAGSGNDELRSYWGGDQLYGGAGNDILSGVQGNCILDGGDGDDMVTFNASMPGTARGGIGQDRLDAIGINAVSIDLSRTQNQSLMSGVQITGFETIRFHSGSATAADYIIGGSGIDELYGGGGNDNLQGRDGNDDLHGQAGGDALEGGNGNDYLYADDDVSRDTSSSYNYLFGGAGDDQLHTGHGVDLLSGGTGNDILYNNEPAVSMTQGDAISGGEGFDTLFLSRYGSSVAYSIDMTPDEVSVGDGTTLFGIEQIRFDLGNANDLVIGAIGDDVLWGNGGDDHFDGAGGDDRLYGGAGSDGLSGGAGNDHIYATDWVQYEHDDPTSVNSLYGGDGDDYLEGAEGRDFMHGGAGNDFIFDQNIPAAAWHADVINGGDGYDIVAISRWNSAIAYNLNLVDGACADIGDGTSLTGVEQISFNAGRGDDDLYSAGGDDYLYGNAGQDVLSGGGGNDGLGGGLDADVLIGGTGSDFLDGGEGADVLIGGTGNDVYSVDNAQDFVNEELGAGIDEVRVNTLTTYTLGEHLENLNGDDGAVVGQALTGNALNNAISGGGGDTLFGLAGNDTLLLYWGIGTMAGGVGNDTYIVTDVGQTVIESNNAGTDIVHSSVTFNLAPQYIENLTLSGSAAINGSGNSLNNIITGNAGANVINGRSGADTMKGGDGDDTYIVDDVADVIREGSGAGTDTVKSSVTYSLAGQQLELLTLTGSAAINGSGNSLANTIVGNGAANVISGLEGVDKINGGGGDDRVAGGSGSDFLTGGTGSDFFVFDARLSASSNVDTISDFSVAADTIVLLQSIFSAATAGSLSAAAFVAGTAASDANDRIIHDQATGKVYYDSDGIGASTKVLFATVTKGIALTNNDFVVVSSADLQSSLISQEPGAPAAVDSPFETAYLFASNVADDGQWITVAVRVEHDYLLV